MTFMLGICPSYVTLLWHTIMAHCYLTLLWHTIIVHYFWYTIMAQYYGTLSYSAYFTGHNIDSLFEDIHWLLLIATNILTLDCTGDKASIPSDIFAYEVKCQQRGEVDVNASVAYISKLGRGCGTENSKLPQTFITYMMLLYTSLEFKFK